MPFFDACIMPLPGSTRSKQAPGLNRLSASLSPSLPPHHRQAKIGPGQVGLAVGALLFGLAFVLVSGGDFATTSRYKGLRPSSPPPEPIEMSRLASQAERFEAAADANPGDVEVRASHFALLQRSCVDV